jgi:hypothetical protein
MAGTRAALTRFNGIAINPVLSEVWRSTFSQIFRLGVLPPLFESILAIVAVAALVAGLLSVSVPLESPISPTSMDYEAN